MLITSSIPNLINGVSQQPATLRLASQAEAQVNFLSSVTDGLVRRPGSKHLAKITTDIWTDSFLHTINRDATEKYLVCIRAGILTVFNAKTGVAQTVTAPGGYGYLTATSKAAYRAVTVADYTFIVNREKTVAMSATLSPASPNAGLVTIKAGNYGKRYRVYVEGILRGGYDTPDGSSVDHIQWVRTGHIAVALRDSLIGGGYSGSTALPSSYTVTLIGGDVIYIVSPLSTVMTLRVDDDTGGNAAVAVVRTAQKFADLPKVAPNGFAVEIIGDRAANTDNYHVKFSSEGATGVWKESLKGGEKFSFDDTTMPHILVRESNGSFTFKAADWADREVGDVEQIPEPSFVGRQFGDVFFYRNRLGFLSDENVILSKLSEFFDFWRDTAVTLLDTDPLDIAVSNTKVSLLNHALPFNQTLLLFSNGAQFTLRSGDILSAETAYVTQSTEFDNVADVRPVGAGQYVYFPVPRGAYTGVREYFVDTGNEQNDALDITSHCPHYIPEGLFKMASSTAEDVIVMLSALSPNSVWVYKFFYGEGGKLQSSWSEWRLPSGSNILSAEFIDTTLYMVVSRSDGTFIESMAIESGAKEVGAAFHYHCDRTVVLTGGTYNATTQTTTFTLPYASTLPDWVFVGPSDTVYGEGYVPPYTRPTSSTVRLTGDWTGRVLRYGVRFESRYQFSTFYVRDTVAGGGMVALNDGRLQVRRLFIVYAESGYFRVDVTQEERPTGTAVFTGRRLAAASATMGRAALSEGRFSVPVMARNTSAKVEIISDHFLPASFTSAEWEATYHARAKRV